MSASDDELVDPYDCHTCRLLHAQRPSAIVRRRRRILSADGMTAADMLSRAY